MAARDDVSDPVVCCIGCTDPWNAAGLGLDIRALAECGAYAVTVVAGITAQDRAGVWASQATAVTLVEAQLHGLRTVPIAAYRIGALLDAATVEAVATHLSRTDVPAVYDPALGASGGGSFGDATVHAAIASQLVPVVALVTPNLAEAAALTDSEVSDVRAMEAAAHRFVALGAGAAFVKGGHLAGSVADVLVDRLGTVVYEDERLPGSLRGTGCLLAASAAASLARGETLRDAIDAARTFVRAKLEHPHLRAGMHLAY